MIGTPREAGGEETYVRGFVFIFLKNEKKKKKTAELSYNDSTLQVHSENICQLSVEWQERQKQDIFLTLGKLETHKEYYPSIKAHKLQI